MMLLSVLVQQAGEFLLLDKELKEKLCCVERKTVLISVIKIIKVVTFNMNPKFTEVTLNSFTFVMDVFCTSPARKFGIIDLTHEA